MEDSKIVSLVNKLISSNVEKIINSVLRRKYLLSRKAVIVNDYNSVNDTASIIIPSDPNMATNYFYPNKTGHRLVVGAKMYLVYQTTNISQGWLEDNKSTSFDYEIKEAFGNVGYSWETKNTFRLYAQLRMVKYPNGIYKINGTGRIEDLVKNVPSSFDYGLHFGYIRTLLGMEGLPVPVGFGHFNIMRSLQSGYLATLDDIVGYGGGFDVFATGMMRPTRYYKTDGTLGSWPIDPFKNGDLFEFEFYMKQY